MKLGFNHPMGPFTLLDFVGLDTLLFIADAMYEEFKDARYAAPPLLRRMVQAGLWGARAGGVLHVYKVDDLDASYRYEPMRSVVGDPSK